MSTSTSTSVRLSRLGSACIVLVALLVTAGAAQASLDGTHVIQDTFARTTFGGWGNADVGGAYTYDGPTDDFSVVGGAGWVWLRDGTARRAVLPDAPIADGVAETGITLGQLPPDGTVSAAIVARGGATDADPSYRGVVTVAQDGTATASIKSVAGGSPHLLGTPAVLPFRVLPGNSYTVRLSVAGSWPTTLTMTVFPIASPVPAPQVTVIDSTPEVQQAGVFGLRARRASSAGALPMMLGFDHLEVVAPEGGSGDTEPPSAPTGITFSNVTDTGAGVSWDASTDNVGVTRYDIFVDGGIVSSTTTSAELTDLSCGTTYTVWVTANDAAGNVSTPAPAELTTADCSSGGGGGGGGVPPGALSVLDYGAAPGDAGNDTPAFHATLIAAAARGKAVDVPPGAYRLDNLTWVSDVEMVAEPGVVFMPFGTSSTPGTIMTFDNVQNVHFRSSDGSFVRFDVDAASSGGNRDDRAVALRNVSNFTLSDIEIQMNDSHTDSTPPTQSSSGIRFARNVGTAARDGVISHIRGVNAPYGYGTIEMNAGSQMRFDDISTIGGIALRIELEADINGVNASHITGTDCKSALSYSAHQFRLTDAHTSDVTSTSCQYGITIHSTGGSFAGDSISQASVTGGPHAQIVRPGKWPKNLSFPWDIGPSKGCIDDQSHGAVTISGLDCST